VGRGEGVIGGRDNGSSQFSEWNGGTCKKAASPPQIFSNDQGHQQGIREKHQGPFTEAESGRDRRRQPESDGEKVSPKIARGE